MKKQIQKAVGILLSAAVLTAGTSFATLAASADTRRTVSVADARRVLRDAVSLEAMSESDRKFADMDFDSKITVADARSVLRIAVSLDSIDGMTYENEYEMLSGGFYTVEASVGATDESGKTEQNTFKIAVTQNSCKLYLDGMSSMFGEEEDGIGDILGMFSAILISNDKVSLLDEKNKAALTVSKSEIGGLDDLSTIVGDIIPSLHTSLSDASSTKSASVDGTACTVYTFDETDGDGVKYTSNVYMNGKKLVRIEYADTDGSVFTAVSFKSLSRIVAAGETNLSGYDNVTGLFG